MGEPSKCWGHREREKRNRLINGILTSPLYTLNDLQRVLIKRGTVSEETSLKELEKSFSSNPEWRVIVNGGVVSLPVEVFRMINPPRPDKEGNIDYGRRTEGAGRKIEHYPPAQTIENLNNGIVSKYNKELDDAKAAHKSNSQAEIDAHNTATKLPEFCAVQKWKDIHAEIKVKKALEGLMNARKIPSLIIRSIDMKKISALKDMGIDIPDSNSEIDLVLVYASGELLNVVVFEVKRADDYPWEMRDPRPNKQAVNKAEDQLTKDVKFFKSVLTGIPSSQIRLRTLACFPDSPSTKVRNVCTTCLDEHIICQEDLTDLTKVQRKIRVPENLVAATPSALQCLLTLSTRLLSHQSLLHVGYRTDDKEKRADEKQSFNVEFADRKIQQREFIQASPHQQQVIASFTSSSIQKHLVLKGQAGAGKTLVALQVAKNLIESITCEEQCKEPVLVVTSQLVNSDEPLMRFLDYSTRAIANRYKWVMTWEELKTEFGCSSEPTEGKRSQSDDETLLRLSDALTKVWEGQQIVLVVDEIFDKDLFSKIRDQTFPESVRMILVVNPQLENPSILPPAFLQVTLTIPYRSTIAITSLARFMEERISLKVPEGDLGTDVEGVKPMYFDIGSERCKIKEALVYCCNQMGVSATILHGVGPDIEELVKEGAKSAGIHWNIHNIESFYGWEADRVVAVVNEPTSMMELITRAKLQLAVIILDDGLGTSYEDMKYSFEAAEERGLVKKIRMKQ